MRTLHETGLTVQEQLIQEAARSGLRKAEIARRAGLPQQTVARVLGAERAPTIDTAQKIAKALGTTLADLLRPLGRSRVAPCGHKVRLPDAIDYVVHCRDCGATVEWVLVGVEA